jgi:hypothetical protein
MFRKGSLLCAAAVLLLCGVRLPAQQDGGEVRIDDPRESYVVGFSELSSVDLPPEYRYIASTLPRLLANTFGGSVTHRYAPEERTAYAETLVRQEASSARVALSNAVRQRDNLLFDQASEARIEQARDSVDTARRAYEAVLSFNPDDADVPQEKPVAFWAGKESGRLLEPVPLDADLEPVESEILRITEAADLDLLIWGVVEEVRGYLWVRFIAYSPYAVSIPLELTTTALPSEINQEATSLADGIAAAILGRSWSEVRVVTDVDDAAIYVNDELMGFGTAEARLLPPGATTVTIRAQGYREESRELDLEAGESVTLDLALEPVVERVVRVESAPADADVYVDSVWVGRTPVRVTVADEPRIVRLRADGHLESRFVLTVESPDRVARVLLPDSIDWGVELQTARDEFYRSLSWFVISVPVTMILNGVYQNVYSAYPPAAGPQLASFGRLGNIFYWSYWGGLLVNVGLFVNVGINLFEYLDVGEGAHNQ